MTERGIAGAGLFSSSVATGTSTSNPVFGGSVQFIQNTLNSGVEDPVYTWEHPIKWSELYGILSKIPNFDSDIFITYMQQNANSLEDHLDSAYVKTGGGIVQGNLLYRGIGCKLQKGANQAIATGTQTAVLFGASDTEVFDSDGFHDPATNNTRITIPANLGGKYLVTGAIGYTANTTGMRFCSIYKNGALDTSNRVPATSTALSSTLLTATTVLSLAAGDYVEMYAFQDSTVSLNVLAASYSSFSVMFMGQ